MSMQALNYLVAAGFPAHQSGTRARAAPRSPTLAPYRAKAGGGSRRERPVAQWRVAAVQAATGAARMQWETQEAFAERLQREAAAVRTHARAGARAANDFGATATELLLEGRRGRGLGVTLANVEPLPDTHLDFIGVYVLQSLVIPSRVYVGFSTDPAHRLRQHQGELSGGAKFTEYGRPWKMCLHVSGFRSKTRALQFEWALTKIKRSASARPLLALPLMRGLASGRIGQRARLAQLLMYAPKFCGEPLRVTWLCAETQAAHELDFGDGEGDA